MSMEIGRISFDLAAVDPDAALDDEPPHFGLLDRLERLADGRPWLSSMPRLCSTSSRPRLHGLGPRSASRAWRGRRASLARPGSHTRARSSASRPRPRRTAQRWLRRALTPAPAAPGASRLHSPWPNAIASSIVSSGISLAPDSTIRTASSVAGDHELELRRLLLRRGRVGDQTCRRSDPTRTAPMGPSNGMPDRHRAAEAPFTARTSGSFSWSPEMRQADDLHLVLESVGEQRPDRPVDETRRQRLLLDGRPSRLK